MPAVSVRRDLVSIADGADYAKCSIRTIRRRISAGELTGYRFGARLIRIDLAELDAAMAPIPTAKRGAA